MAILTYRQLSREYYETRRNGALDCPRDPEAPKTRRECIDGPRPCPWVGCRYHLGLDITQGGGIRVNRDLTNMPDTCALDVADRGPQTLEAVGKIYKVTRQAIEQCQTEACAKLAKRVAMQEFRSLLNRDGTAETVFHGPGNKSARGR